jgi:hypothetical protein
VRSPFSNQFHLFLKSLAVSWFIIFFWAQPTRAEFDLECYISADCTRVGGGTSSNPSAGNEIRLNPAAVPMEKGFGVEVVYFGTPEWSIVQGLGRAGASISPANSEETFFGPPAVEYPSDFLERHRSGIKYESQKYTLSTAFKVAKHGSGRSRFNLNIGAMAKYNKYTYRTTPGGGLGGAFGPILFGASIFLDETQLDPELDPSIRISPIRYKVQTYNLGLYLTSVILNYSNLQMIPENGGSTSTIKVLMASLLTKRFVFNLAHRAEDSTRSWYNPYNDSLETKQIKEDYFLGVQYRMTKKLMTGVFLNYFMLNELSLTGTLFF